MRVLAAVDKFRGTATAAQVAASIGHACWENGHECIELPIADGGEGTLEVLGGPNRTSRVTNPLGQPVDAQWRLARDLAVIEMARASGLSLVGGKLNNDVIAASTIGTGELIDTALNDGAKRIIVCVGGSATVDGGLGAIRAIKSAARLRGVEFLVACDVRAKFTDAAKLFGAQKGATPAQIEFYYTSYKEMISLFAKPYVTNTFDFSEEQFFEDLYTYGEKVAKMPEFKQARGVKHFIYINRTNFGLYNILHELKAKVRTDTFKPHV